MEVLEFSNGGSDICSDEHDDECSGGGDDDDGDGRDDATSQGSDCQSLQERLK